MVIIMLEIASFPYRELAMTNREMGWQKRELAMTRVGGGRDKTGLFFSAVNVCEDCAGDVVPYGEDGAGDGRHGK